MSNKERSLFVCEGVKTEQKLIRKLERNFLGGKFAITCAYEAEIYQLYRCVKPAMGGDFPVDIVNILKARSVKNSNILRDFNRDSFASVYLFFDYDAHSSLADDGKLREMLDFFDNETENGKLFVSYPMVEAIGHYRDMESFKSLAVKCKRGRCPRLEVCPERESCLGEPGYKRLVASDSRPQLRNYNAYSREVWSELITAHLYKLNYLVEDRYEFPTRVHSQLKIFDRQREKHISMECPKVAVLSGIPPFVLDYYGCEQTRMKLGKNGARL